MKIPEMPVEDMFHRERPHPPKFKSQMKPLMNLSENQPAHFECRLVPVGDPDMQVEWYKDGTLLRHGLFVMMTHFSLSFWSSLINGIIHCS